MFELMIEESGEIIRQVHGTRRLRELGRYDEALIILEGIRQNHQFVYENQIETRRFIEEAIASISSEKAQKLYGQGKHREACSLLVGLLENSVIHLSVSDQLHYKNQTALYLLESGKYARSYKMFEEVASGQAELLSPSDRSLLCTQGNKARALDRLERYEESLALYEDILDKMRRNLGDDDLLTMTTRLNMAVVLLKTGATEKALEQFDDVLERRKRILGPDDPETFMAQNNVAEALIALNRLTEAFDIFTEVFDKRKRKLGSDHPDTLRTQGLIGFVLWKQAKYSEALRLLNEVLAKQKSLLGDAHPDTQGSLAYIEALKIRVGQKKFADLQSSCKGNDDDFAKLIVLINAGDVSGVNNLLENEIDITRVTALKGNTPLHFAVNKNKIDTIESLLKYVKKHLSPQELRNFIDTRTTSTAGNTAMHIAASNGSLDAIKVLLRYGATHNIKNKRSKTPRELANDPEIVSFLELKQSSVSSSTSIEPAKGFR